MVAKLLYVLGLSLGICIVNYLASFKSNLSSIKALLLDSVVDLAFPVLSLLAVNFGDDNVNIGLALVQSILMTGMSIYFVNRKLEKREDLALNSTLSLISMILSIGLTYICVHITESLSHYGPSLQATGAHFKLDFVLKVSVIVISLINITNIKKGIKSFIISLLDFASIGYVFGFSAFTLMHVLTQRPELYASVPIIFGFLMGAIPFAVIFPLIFFGIDVRQSGSQNPGTTNVKRVISREKGDFLGGVFSYLVGALDVFKGYLPALLFPGSASVACVSAVLGHMYSPFLGFKGGKGVATFGGALFGITGSWFFIGPIACWYILSFNKYLLHYLPIECQADHYAIHRFRIKEGFLISLISMSYAMLLVPIVTQNRQIWLQVFTLFLFICYRHKDDFWLE